MGMGWGTEPLLVVSTHHNECQCGEVARLIRALWLFDPFGTRILHWVHTAYEKGEQLEKLEDGFLYGPLSNAIRDFVNQANKGEKKSENLRFKGHRLILCFEKGFLVIAEADSPKSFEAALPPVLQTLDNAIVRDPLSFCELLANYDMPGKNRLTKKLSTLLQSQAADAEDN
jgi:hypothetical protein